MLEFTIVLQFISSGKTSTFTVNALSSSISIYYS
jgi:hypothetical protein